MQKAVAARGRAPNWQVWAALIVVYLVWGSTYLAIAVVVKTMPPLLSASLRFVVAGLVMAVAIGMLRGWGKLRLSRDQIVGSALVGIALLLGGNGLVMLGERLIASGLAALIIGVVPLWIVLMRVASGEHVRRGTLAGVLLGFAGVALLVSGGLSGEFNLLGILLIIGSSISWSLGSFYSRRAALPADPIVSSAAQMFCGGVALGIVGVLAGEVPSVRPEQFAPEGIAALVYLVVFGSIIGYSAYTWLLQNAPVSKVATYAYVNPVVAIALGFLILAEPVTPAIAIGGALIVASVALVISTESRSARRATARSGSTTAGAVASRSRPA
jgi:drug/metabolite transporter (DMT)-like permease